MTLIFAVFSLRSYAAILADFLQTLLCYYGIWVLECIYQKYVMLYYNVISTPYNIIITCTPREV